MQAGNYTIVPKAPGELARGQAATGARVATGNTLTRRAGGHELIAGAGLPAHAAPRRPRVIVDTREFMSPLPAVLYGRGIDVVPVTLEVRTHARHARMRKSRSRCARMPCMHSLLLLGATAR
jgi:hypothetical protein